jgi:DNA-binding XRE family transcriptional regulator
MSKQDVQNVQRSVNTNRTGQRCTIRTMDAPHLRLREMREKRGFESAFDAARAYGWNENTYSSHENGNRGISPDAAIKYSRAFRFSLDWLYTGTNPMKTHGLEEEPHIAFKVIPRLSWEFMKNHRGVEEAMERAVEYTSLPKNLNISMPAFSMTIADDSMVNTIIPGPSFSRGDEVVFSVSSAIKPGDFVLAELSHEDIVVFRQYQERGRDAKGFMTYALTPLNNSYPTTHVTSSDQARIIAKMTHAIKAYI